MLKVTSEVLFIWKCISASIAAMGICGKLLESMSVLHVCSSSAGVQMTQGSIWDNLASRTVEMGVKNEDLLC